MKKGFMKTISMFLTFIFFSSSASLQQSAKADFDNSGNIFFQRIDSINKSKDELFSISKEWIVNTFKSGKAVIELEDKEKGIIIGKGATEKTITKYNFKIFYLYTIKIEMKDSKARLTIYNIYSKGTGLEGHERTAEFWFGPLCKKCKQSLFDEHQKNIVDVSDLLLSNFFKVVNEKPVSEDW